MGSPLCPSLLTLAGCDVCGDVSPGRLFAVVDRRRYCRECWRKAGEPFPRHIPSEIEVANAAAAVQRRTITRGGTDRHLARSGKS